MLKRFYSFVVGLSFLPHMGDEIGDLYADHDDNIPVGKNFGFDPKKNMQVEDEDEYQFLNDETEPFEDDWDKLDDTEDEFDALMRKKERQDEERFSWFVFSLGVLSFVGLAVGLSVKMYRKFLTF